MITPYNLRVGNYLHDREGRLCRVEEVTKRHFKAPAIYGGLTSLDHNPIELTKEWAYDLGFTITDFCDYWEFERKGFILVQFKLKVGVKVKDLVPSYILPSTKPKHIKVQYVHKLQNLYFEIMEEELNYNRNT